MIGISIKAVAAVTNPNSPPSPSSPPPASIQVGGQIIVATGGCSVRSTPAGALMGSQVAGTIGTVTAGPTPMPAKPNILDNRATNWWNVTFPAAPNGWVGELVISGYGTPPCTYVKWMAKLNTEVGTNPTPSILLAWINSNPPTAD